MNFYRHRLTSSQDFIDNMPSFLDEWGFCLPDNSPIIDTSFVGNSNDTSCFKYKYDTDTHPFRKVNPTPLHNFKVDNTIPDSECGFYIWIDKSSSVACANTHFFIPLKNQGFILRSETADIDTLTPPFHSYDYYPNKGWNYGNNNPIINTIIGLFESSFSNPMIYLQIKYFPQALLDPNTLIPYKIYSSINTNAGKGSQHRRFDLIIENHLIQFPSFIEDPCFYGIGNSSHEGDPIPLSYQKTTNKYTNTIQNVCTLIRAPYENQYLDNLYIVTTKPCDSIDGKVFSFDGRNFLGIYDNLAVELPAN